MSDDIVIGSVTFRITNNTDPLNPVSLAEYNAYLKSLQALAIDPKWISDFSTLSLSGGASSILVPINFGLPTGVTLGLDADGNQIDAAQTKFTWDHDTGQVIAASIDLDISGDSHSITQTWFNGQSGGEVAANAVAVTGKEWGNLVAAMNPDANISLPSGVTYYGGLDGQTHTNQVFGTELGANDTLATNTGTETLIQADRQSYIDQTNSYAIGGENYDRNLMGEPTRADQEEVYPDHSVHDPMPTGTEVGQLIQGNQSFLADHVPLAVADWIDSHLFIPWLAGQYQGSPLVLDLSATATGISLSSLASDPVYWDIANEGFKHASGWVSGDTGLLCIDLNSNGIIDDNGELFGNSPAGGASASLHTPPAANGFQALAVYDSNSDGVIDSSDTQFGDLRVWLDANHNGVTDTGELQSLSDLGITSIDLNYSAEDYDISGNTVKQQSTFVMNGDSRTIADAWFTYDNVNTVYNQPYTLDGDTAFLPEVRGYGLLPDLSIAMSNDSTLLGLVQDLAGKTVSELLDPTYHLEDKITAVLYQWAGVQDVDPSSRGGFFDAQKLEFLEKFMDESYQWQSSSEYPGGPGSEAAPDVQMAWDETLGYLSATILGQTVLGSLFGAGGYYLGTDSFSNSAWNNTAIHYGPYSQTSGMNDFSQYTTAFTSPTENDIYILRPGDHPISTGSTGFVINEPTDGGTDTILLGGVSPSDVKMWANSSGDVTISYGTGTSDFVTVENGSYNALDGSGVTVGPVEKVLFDDGTTLDLTGGLHFTAPVENMNVYGTGHDDTIESCATGNDALLGYDGNDTLISHGVGCGLYGGAGNDTYVIGSTGVYVYEGAGGGNDSIVGLPTGKEWTDVFGRLYIGNDTETIIYAIVDNGSYNSSTGFTPGSVEQLVFTDDSTLDLTGGLHLSNPNAGGATYGTSQGDTFDGGTGNDQMFGYGGNDIYNFSSGGGTDIVTEGASQGTDTIALHGITASSVKMWDDTSGNLIIEYTGSDKVTVSNGSYGSSGFSVGNVEQVAFDDATTWDLTGGLHLVNDNTGRSLYGTGSADTIEGGTGGDSLFGYAGNDTLVGHTGADYLAGGDGNDTYSFYSGDGIDSVTEASSGGTDTIALHGISASAVEIWDDTNGQLFIQYTANDRITVIGGSFNSSTGETFTLEQIVFDDSTTWDLTAGVHLIDDSTARTLYGTANADSIQGGSANETLYGYAGSDTLDGGAASDYLAGGTGNDTYSFASGRGLDSVAESSGEGTDTIALHGVSAADVIIKDDAFGDLFIKYTASDQVTIINGSFDSSTGFTVGNVEQVVFDDSTTWNIASGLHLTVDSSGHAYGTSYGDTIEGGSSGDLFYGFAGDDTLDGHAGADHMYGGAGNDTYYVDATGDLPDETLSGDGTDTVMSSVSFTIGTNIENLTLTGSSVLVATGNSLDNVITGNSAASTLIGGAGNDTYVISNASTVITEATSGGTDTVQSSVSYTLSSTQELERLTLTGTGSINGTGNSLVNVITGNSGDNSLSGGSGADTMIGGGGNDTFVVDNASDVITAGTGTDLIQSSVSWSLSGNTDVENLTLTSTAVSGTGNSLNNVITGNSSANTLDGGAGDDTMVGGSGNDLYIVDSANDVITEASSGGTDTVQSSVNYTLSSSQEIENLTLTGSAISGTGNSLVNVITGTSAANTLDGGSGADTMIGGDGNDTFIVDNSSDNVSETSTGGTDTVLSSASSYTLALNVENLTLSGTGNINGTGNSGVNVVTGNSGNNVLDGGSGADTLIGGGGNDTFVVDNASDVITAGSGTDTIQSSLSWNLTSNSDVENLTLTGTAVTGTGNSLNNVITGNSSANTLDGGAGADTMIGGGGNDTFVIDNASDVVTAGSGTDTIMSGVSWSLSSNSDVENLTLSGSANNNGTGNSLVNVITGNSGNNTLDGGTGADTLVGGGGNDTFVVDNASDVVSAGAGTDTIQSGISWDMSSGGHNNTDIENLTLSGSSNINGTGNASNNVITGNSGDNTLDGNGGTDTLIGGAGNDTYIVDTTTDSITEATSGGTDTVVSSVTYTLSSGQEIENLTLSGTGTVNGTGNALNNVITGNSAVNILTGNDGNDTLDGGGGADTLVGGNGDDTYVINNTGITVTESSGAGTGTDTVQSSIAYSLGSNLENLTLTGTSAIIGTGNTGDNVMTGCGFSA